MILAGLYFFAGVLFGLGDGLIYIIGWVVCGILSWIFVYKGFPDMWIYTFHLAFSYMIATFGLIVAFAFPVWFGNKFLFFLAGITLQLPAIILLVVLFRSVFKIREEMALVSKYIPLGIWTINLAGFYFTSLIAALLWVFWARGTINTLIPYILAMGAVSYCTFYIMWAPQKHFREVMETRLTMLGSKMLKSVAPRGKIAKPKKVTACPLCSDPLIIEKRRCPSCDEKREFSWCHLSEVFVISCPHCGRLTSYNSRRCMVCHNPIGRKIKCKCGGSFPIADWELVEEVEEEEDEGEI
jgi:hypothetical protein